MDRHSAIAQMTAKAGAELSNADFIFRNYTGPDHVAAAIRSLTRARTFVDAAAKLALNSDLIPVDMEAEREAGKIIAEMAVTAAKQAVEPGRTRRFVDSIVALFRDGKADRKHAEKALRDEGIDEVAIGRLLSVS